MSPGTFTGRMRKMGGALRAALDTASGMFVRPSAVGLRGSELLGQPSAAGGAADLMHAGEVRAAITQTRKKKRFSAKYPALPKPDAETPTHADLRLGPPAAPANGGDEPPPTKPDLNAELASDAPDRSAARRFPLKDVTQALAVNGGQLQQVEQPSLPPATEGEPAVTLQPAVVEEPSPADEDEEQDAEQGRSTTPS